MVVNSGGNLSGRKLSCGTLGGSKLGGGKQWW